jgi:hypothetical protein
VKGAPKSARELAVRRLFRRNTVDGAFVTIVGQSGRDHTNQIVKVDPGHVLASGPNRSADAEPEWREHLSHRPAVSPKHDTRTQSHNAETGTLGQSGGRFPVLAQPGKKIIATGRQLVENLTATIAVVADGAPGNQRLGTRSCFSNRTDQLLGQLHAALDEHSAARLSPASAHDRFPSEIDDGVTSLQSFSESMCAGTQRHGLDLGAEKTPGPFY